MARTKRREKIAGIFEPTVETVPAISVVAKRYRTGIYVRLSVEDGGLGKESESFYNQERLLLDYVEGMPDLEVVKIYRDNGETGTNFNRPGFDMMMNDLRKGIIDCIVVKDLSRFGRNYIETGEYIEKIFPFMGTRFIAMLEQFDNIDPNASAKDLLVNLKNLMNEAYAKDKSMRICSAFDAKKRAGEFNVKNAPFGYKLSGDKKKPYLIDEPAAEIVREIFSLKKAGESIHSIMRTMDEKYPSPRKYLYDKGLVKKISDNPHWDMTAISRILTNPAYLGHMVRGKTVARLYQGVKKHFVPKEQWEIIEDVNDPIIDKDTYDTVQRLLKKEEKKAKTLWKNDKKQKTENIFKGLLRCRECGRIMYRARTAVTPTNIVRYYGCPKYRDHKERGCEHRPTIREEHLKSVVLAFIKSQAKLAGELEERIARINENAEKLRQTQTDEEITLRERLEKLEFYLRSSFESYISGVITESDYLFNKSKYEAEIASCQAKLNTETTSKSKVTTDEVRRSPYVTSMKKFSRARVLTREMCVSLIELIEVDKNNNVIITPRYRDEFAYLCERIEKEESEMKQNG